jgi:hypothetical protein
MLKPSHLAIVLAVAAACSKSKSGEPGAPGAPSAKPAAESPAGAALQAKLQAGIECMNRHADRIFEAQKAYLEQVDPAKGPPPGKQVHMLGLYAIDQCLDAMKKASVLTPAIPELDQAGTAFTSALATVVNVHDEQKAYYTKGEYQTDGGKKAIDTHAKLVAAFDAFDAAHESFAARVGAENRKVRVADLAAREKAEGRKLGVVLDSLMLEAQDLVHAISVPPAQLLAGDVAALEAKVAVYAKAVDELDTYMKAHPDEAQAYGSRASLVNYSQTLLGATRTVVAKVTAKEEPVDAVEEAIRQYNYLVDNYNR